MKIDAHVHMGLVGCTRKFSVEVEDDCTDDEIDEVVRDTMFDGIIEWGWKRAGS